MQTKTERDQVYSTSGFNNDATKAENSGVASNSFAYSDATNAVLKRLKSYRVKDAQDLHDHISKFYTDSIYRKDLVDGFLPLKSHPKTIQHINNLQARSIHISLLNFIAALLLLTIFLPVVHIYAKIYNEDNIFERTHKNKGNSLLFFTCAPKQTAQFAAHLVDHDYNCANPGN